MEAAIRKSIADELATVYAGASPVAPPTERFPELDLDDAYAIQHLQVERWLASGRSIRGRKIGLTSLAMQRQLGVSEPDYGVLLDSFFYAENSSIGRGEFIQPRIEPELAFILGKDLSGPNVNVADVIDATEWVVPSLEIIEPCRARLAPAPPGLSASSAGFAMASRFVFAQLLRRSS